MMRIYELVKEIVLYLSLAVFTVGILGNFVSLIVYFRKTFHQNSVIFYFKILTIFNTYVVFFSPRNFIEDKFFPYLAPYNDPICKVSDYSIYFGCAVSAWMLVFISLDRLFKFYYPSGTYWISRKQPQRYLTLFLVLFNIGFNSPLLIYSFEYPNESNISKTLCEYKEDITYFWWMDIFNSTIITFLIMFSSTLITLFLLFKLKTKLNKKNARDYKFAISSIGLNISFAVCNLPTTLFFLVSSYVKMEEDDYFLLLAITNILFFINYSMLFYINIMFNSSFRRELFKLVRFDLSSKN